MIGPKRIQLSRKKGWRMPVGVINCARPGKLGNPFTLPVAIESGYATAETAQAFVVECFEVWLAGGRQGRDWWQGPESDQRRAAIIELMPSLRGSDLACWCRLCPRHKGGKSLGEDCQDCAPCHVDPLGRLANALALGNIDQGKA